MKKGMIIVLVGVFFFGATSLSADEFRLPRFLPGDTVSSDLFNDIMKSLEGVKNTVSSVDLVGTWDCISYTLSTARATEWKAGPDSLFFTLDSIITFSDDGDGTYSFVTTAPNPFIAHFSDAVSSPYVVVNNLLYCKRDGCAQAHFAVNKISDSKVHLVNQSGSYTTLMCEKRLLPPLPPSDLNATVDDKTVSLTWTDNSADETGFSIRRKDAFDGEWSEVGTVGADTTSFSEIVSEGKHWYRVFATNGNGDSTGSNVVRADIEETD